MDNSNPASENIRNYRVNHWKKDEDEKLSQLVQEHGPQDWNAIAQHIEGRSGKSMLDVVIKMVNYTYVPLKIKLG